MLEDHHKIINGASILGIIIVRAAWSKTAPRFCLPHRLLLAVGVKWKFELALSLIDFYLVIGFLQLQLYCSLREGSSITPESASSSFSLISFSLAILPPPSTPLLFLSQLLLNLVPPLRAERFVSIFSSIWGVMAFHC